MLVGNIQMDEQLQFPFMATLKLVVGCFMKFSSSWALQRKILTSCDKYRVLVSQSRILPIYYQVILLPTKSLYV